MTQRCYVVVCGRKEWVSAEPGRRVLTITVLCQLCAVMYIIIEGKMIRLKRLQTSSVEWLAKCVFYSRQKKSRLNHLAIDGIFKQQMPV